jgi:hypothetical protein
MESVRFRPRSSLILLLVFGAVLGTSGPASAQIVQVDTSFPMSNAPLAAASVVSLVEQGPANVTITARNHPQDAVTIDLAFRYRIPPDTIALDELIDRIEIATETLAGERHFASAIDAQLIPLNPNRVPLFYRATLYRPTDERAYRVHVRVLGNYE